jgi:endonuclease YncB( thermonuclease family)
MLKDLVEISILTWAIELIASAISGVFKLIGGALKWGFGGVWNLVSPKKESQGKVKRVIDGDSIIVQTDEGVKEVRIRGIDAPEFGQEGFSEAKRATERLTLGQIVNLLDEQTDVYGRTAATVELDHNKTDTAESIAAKGMAYPDPRGADSSIKKASKEAKKKSLGVWKTPQTPPWEFRDMNH